MNGRIKKVLYAHQAYTTFVLEPPTKEVLHNCFTMHANQIIMNAGLSVKSPKDKFVKATGRAEAEKRLAPRLVNLETIQILGTKHIYHLSITIPIKRSSGIENYMVWFDLTTVAESDRVKLISCETMKVYAQT